ncbi:hypothetical protein MMC25_000581 [Agyrium rufum]|nr:hypothetical protein [Agyrium rufum]
MATATISPSKQSAVLQSLDPNTTSPTKNHSKSLKDTTSKPKSMEYHRQVLQSKMEDEQAQQTYISPSDTIMSPCTAKLSALKTKRFGQKSKPMQSLFAKQAKVPKEISSPPKSSETSDLDDSSSL